MSKGKIVRVMGMAASLQRVMDHLSRDDRRWLVVLGLGKDKDAVGMVRALKGRAAKVYATEVSNRAFSGLDLCRIVSEGLCATALASPTAAFAEACRSARDEWVLVTGSLHMVGAIRSQTYGLRSTSVL